VGCAKRNATFFRHDEVDTGVKRVCFVAPLFSPVFFLLFFGRPIANVKQKDMHIRWTFDGQRQFLLAWKKKKRNMCCARFEEGHAILTRKAHTTRSSRQTRIKQGLFFSLSPPLRFLRFSLSSSLFPCSTLCPSRCLSGKAKRQATFQCERSLLEKHAARMCGPGQRQITSGAAVHLTTKRDEIVAEQSETLASPIVLSD